MHEPRCGVAIVARLQKFRFTLVSVRIRSSVTFVPNGRLASDIQAGRGLASPDHQDPHRSIWREVVEAWKGGRTSDSESWGRREREPKAGNRQREINQYACEVDLLWMMSG